MDGNRLCLFKYDVFSTKYILYIKNRISSKVDLFDFIYLIQTKRQTYKKLTIIEKKIFNAEVLDY